MWRLAVDAVTSFSTQPLHFAGYLGVQLLRFAKPPTIAAFRGSGRSTSNSPRRSQTGSSSNSSACTCSSAGATWTCGPKASFSRT
jgi:hypothetical protein